jgi:hypothetical protein
MNFQAILKILKIWFGRSCHDCPLEVTAASLHSLCKLHKNVGRCLIIFVQYDILKSLTAAHGHGILYSVEGNAPYQRGRGYLAEGGLTMITMTTKDKTELAALLIASAESTLWDDMMDVEWIKKAFETNNPRVIALYMAGWLQATVNDGDAIAEELERRGYEGIY